MTGMWVHPRGGVGTPAGVCGYPAVVIIIDNYNRKKTCKFPLCKNRGQRGWRMGFCGTHAKEKGLGEQQQAKNAKCSIWHLKCVSLQCKNFARTNLRF